MVSALALACGLNASAATQAQMERARAIAAKYYLRFANNGSAYLDELKPQTLSELEQQLKTVEKENLVWFKNAGMPSDYASWDKEQLVKYWSDTFFSKNASSLTDDKKREAAANGLAHKQIANAIKAMEVTVGQESAPAAAQESAKPANEETPQQADLTAVENDKAEIESQIAAIQEEMAAESDRPEQKGKSSGLWVYIMILCILVAVVIALAVYAAKTMKQQKIKKDSIEDSLNSRENSPYAPSGDSGRRIRELEDDIDEKTRENNYLKRQVTSLKDENESLKAEVGRLRSENERALLRMGEMEASRNAARNSVREEPAPEKKDTREVYLGRVNDNGIFVRADRNLNPGISIYRLTTNNGLTGTFEVVTDRSSCAVAIEAPHKWLAGGCQARDINDTLDKHYIITDNPGTAIFEDGTWRVLRKAKIRYE